MKWAACGPVPFDPRTSGWGPLPYTMHNQQLSLKMKSVKFEVHAQKVLNSGKIILLKNQNIVDRIIQLQQFINAKFISLMAFVYTRMR